MLQSFGITESHRHPLGVEHDYNEPPILQAYAARQARPSSGSHAGFDADVLLPLVQQFVGVCPVLLTAYHRISFLMREKWRC